MAKSPRKTLVPKQKVNVQWSDRITGALLTAGLGWLFFISPVGDGLKHLSYELPFLFRSNQAVDEVVIIYQDEESHAKLGEKYDRLWDRALHAQLLERLSALGAKAVVFDILFDARSSNDASDERFYNAVTNYGRAIVSTKAIPHLIDGEVVGLKLAKLFTNFPHWGVAEVSGEDKAVRQHYRDTVSQAPSLAWTTAQFTMSHPPTNPALPRWINYYGPPGTIPHFSYWQVLSKDLTVAAVSNKVVFVGALYSTGFTGGRGTDDFRTPYTRWTHTKSPGVEVSATTYLNLRRGDWLTEAPLWLEWVLLTVSGLALGYGMVVCRSMTAAGVGLAASLLIGSAATASVWLTHVWFPWLLVAGLQVPGALGWAVLANTRRLYREKERLLREVADRPGFKRAPYPSAQVTPPAGGPRPAAIYPPVLPMDAGAPPPIPDHHLLRCIGKGAYGEVWLARDAIMTFHAVKIVYESKFEDRDPYDREFRGMQKFTPISRSHPGFVHILHVGRNEEAGYFYYIMEVADDEVLRQQFDPRTYLAKNLQRELKRRGGLPVSECLQLGLDLTAALEHLHQSELIHRDIKPANIIFVNSVPKLADIGLVTDIAGTGRGVTYMGTEHYIAPEGPGSPAADVYSLGKVLYEASTGLAVARFPDLTTAVNDRADSSLFFQLNKVVMKACEQAVAKRYQTAAAMREDLLQLQAHKRLKRKGWF